MAVDEVSRPFLRVLESREGLGVVHLMLGVFVQRAQQGSCRIHLSDRNRWQAGEYEPSERPPYWVAELSGLAVEERVAHWLPLQFLKLVQVQLWRDYHLNRLGVVVKHKDHAGIALYMEAGFRQAPVPQPWPWGAQIDWMSWEPAQIVDLESMVEQYVSQDSAGG